MPSYFDVPGQLAAHGSVSLPQLCAAASRLYSAACLASSADEWLRRPTSGTTISSLSQSLPRLQASSLSALLLVGAHVGCGVDLVGQLLDVNVEPVLHLVQHLQPGFTCTCCERGCTRIFCRNDDICLVYLSTVPG